MMKFGQAAKPPAALPAAAPGVKFGSANPFMAKSGSAMDPLGVLQAQLKSKEVKFTPNQPALPHFASKSWIA